MESKSQCQMVCDYNCWKRRVAQMPSQEICAKGGITALCFLIHVNKRQWIKLLEKEVVQSTSQEICTYIAIILKNFYRKLKLEKEEGGR